MARDSEVMQRQHFCHHGDTICHPKSGYVTTKLHGTSTCGCNSNAMFSGRAVFTFPTVVVCRPRESCPGKALTVHAKVQYGSTVEIIIFVFNISFLPKYSVKYYDYIVKW